MADSTPYVTIRTRGPSARAAEAMAGPSSGDFARSATHDISRTNFHVKHIGQFAQRLEDSAARAFPNRGRSSQRYSKVQALLLHWSSDDLFVIPELEDLEKCLSEDYHFNTDIFGIPSENSHLELMLRLGQLIKDHESPDTLFVVYYGGHARIDESRQSTWCATREASSPWLQWSAIQTLLERSTSDVLILLDCCAGAASATFPNGASITETISASSWDAIAPDPGRYSFTNALIEVLQEWRVRAFSAAMLHAEVLARLKHPRPITINGKYFEARSTPVHFMMTSNHKAPSIELSRMMDGSEALPSPDLLPMPAIPAETGRAADPGVSGPPAVARNDYMFTEPNEDTPHVMISLALEDDQKLDINAWEQWLSAFPAMAKYVKVQGVFKSHSTLLLVSLPVTIWDMLPEDHATSFVAFIRSNNLMAQKQRTPSVPVFVPSRAQHESTTAETASFMSGVSGTTFTPTENTGAIGSFSNPSYDRRPSGPVARARGISTHQLSPVLSPLQQTPSCAQSLPVRPMPSMHPMTSLSNLQSQPSSPSLSAGGNVTRQMIMNQQQSMRRTTFGDDVPEPKKFAPHIEQRLEVYYQSEQFPNDGQKSFIASNLGVEPWHIEVWFHHRREKDAFAQRFASLQAEEENQSTDTPRMILPAGLNQLLDISTPSQVLLLDLRSLAEYQRSHIKGALHLRAPQSFLRPASLDMVERAFADAQSRRSFSYWRRTRCVVFYASGLESPWECPAAHAMLEKFRAAGWQGQCFILKGHYREFSHSYEKHIQGIPDAHGFTDNEQSKGTVTLSGEDLVANQQAYAELLSQLDREDQLRHLRSSTGTSEERASAMQSYEKELESEFQNRFPALYRKAQDVHGGGPGRSDDDGGSFVNKAHMVEYLDRGLAKMREAQGVPPPPPPAINEPVYAPGHSKLAADASYFDRAADRESEEFVEVGRSDDLAPVGGASPHLTGKGKETRATPSPEEMARRGGRGGNILNKVFRR